MGRGRWGSRLLRPGQAGDGPRGGHQRDQQPPPHGVQGAEGGSPSHKTSRTQTQADAPVPAEVTNSSKHLRHRTNLFLKHFFSKKGRNHPTSSKLCPQVEGLQTWEWGGALRGAGRSACLTATATVGASLGKGPLGCRLPQDGLWGSHRPVTSHLPALCPHGQSCQDPSGSRVCCSCEASCFLESSRDRGAAHRLGPRPFTALTHREKPLEAKLKTKILLSMITSQVLILTLLCGFFKLCFWKLLASPRSTTKI